MHDELAEIRDFLAEVPPFHQLPAAELAALGRRLVIRYLRRGSDFPPAAAAHLWIIRQGAVDLRRPDGSLGRRLAEADSSDAACLPDSEEARWSGHAAEDSLLYGLPLEALEQLWQQYPELRAQALEKQGERLRRARQEQEAEGRSRDLSGLQLAQLITRPPVQAAPDLAIREAAALMTRERVSALLLVAGGQLAGIVTDRDLRSRCLAAGLPDSSPVGSIMTAAPKSLPPEAPAFEALLLMSRQGIHHLPVMAGGQVQGLVSSTDLLRAQGVSVVDLADRLRRAASLEALARAMGELPELWLTLARRGDGATALGRLVSGLTDLLTQRLLQLAEARLGPAPVPYAWIAYGSHGRQELTLFSDQDNALVLADSYDPDRHGDYFRQLCTSVCDGLAACGFILCPGGMMACNPQWRRSQQDWSLTFLDWITRTDPQKARLASNLFDFRCIAGDEDLTRPLGALIQAEAPRHQGLLAQMVSNTATRPAPLGFFRQFLVARSGAHQGQLDLKFHGLMPIHELARIHALAAGCAATGTAERLQATAGQALLSREGAEDLLAACDFLQALRLSHHRQLLAAGRPLDNFVAPETLSHLDRQRLRDVFGIIATQQQALGASFQETRVV